MNPSGRDSLQVVRMIQGQVDIFALVSVLIGDVQRLKQEFVEVKVSFVRRVAILWRTLWPRMHREGVGLDNGNSIPPVRLLLEGVSPFYVLFCFPDYQ